MPEHWKTFKLEDVVDEIIDYRGRTPRKSSKGVPLITAKIIKHGRINAAEEFIATESYDGWMTRGIPKRGDVVLTTEAPLGEVAQINTDEKIALAQRVITLRGKPDVLDNAFLRYFLQSPMGQSNLKAKESGTTVTGIKQSELRQLEINAPEVTEQRRIGHLLSSLDEKIELNLQTNATLETIAEAIFKCWFVDFQYPGFDGELVDGLPRGWRQVELDEVLSLIIDHRGKTPTKLGGSWSQSGIPAISARNVKNRRLVSLTDVGYVNEDLYGDWMTKELRPDDVLLTSEGPLGEVAILLNETRYCLSQRLFALRTNDRCDPLYLFHYLASENGQSELQKRATGTTVVGIRQSELRTVEIVLPSADVQGQFAALARPIQQKIDVNDLETKTLRNVRDSLLPKLISGEIRISE